MVKFLLSLVLASVVTHDTFISAVGPPLPPQGNSTRMLASRVGGTLQSRAMFRTDTVKPWHVLELTNLAQNTPNAQLQAYDVVSWNWNEATATWQNMQGTTQNPVACKMTFMGDVNLDGKVDNADWGVINQHWQQQTTEWTEGDLNGDGVVTSKDLNLVGTNFRKDVATQPAEILFIPKSGNNIAVEPINTSSVRFKTKEAIND